MKLSIPTESATGRPIADHTEYLPPTQSQTGKTLSSATPKLIAPFLLLVIAMKCFSIATGASEASKSHFFAIAAFSAVSGVLNDFEATIKIVVSGLSSLITSSKCEGSTFDTKCKFCSPTLKSSKASHTSRGPRSEPPIPMLTMSLIFLPLNPFHFPEWIRLTIISIRWRQSLTSLCGFSLAGIRRAVCKT